MYQTGFFAFYAENLARNGLTSCVILCNENLSAELRVMRISVCVILCNGKIHRSIQKSESKF